MAKGWGPDGIWQEAAESGAQLQHLIKSSLGAGVMLPGAQRRRRPVQGSGLLGAGGLQLGV